MKTQAKERPILFSGEMVRAILAGKKTQTRRPVKPQPDPWRDECPYESRHPGERGTWVWTSHEDTGCAQRIDCPFGKPGDKLWVRETWFVNDFRVDDRGPVPKERPEEIADPDIWYRADGEFCDHSPEEYGIGERWRPSVHMPRWASRIALEVVEVRVERVQEITREDAVAEGFEMPTQAAGMHPWPEDRFRDTWCGIYGENKSYQEAWGKNPWVWVCEFKRCK